MEKIILSEEGLSTLFGSFDQNLKTLEETFKVIISARGPKIFLQGEPERVVVVENLLVQLSDLLKEGYPLKKEDFDAAVGLFQRDPEASIRRTFFQDRFHPTGKKTVYPKSANQQRYIQAIQEHDIVFGIGPAGTGKTYLAMAMAISQLSDNQFTRIVLTRPAVEAGERLGYLPGTLSEKIDPYLRPLYDALHDLMDMEKANRLIERNVIEIAPLAYMRGRTLNDSFLILDEAQNTTGEQMKMFLTRLGFSSRAIITGDITQVDLPAGRTSGLIEAREVMEGIEGISFVHFDETDVVRHPLVQQIIRAYEEQSIRKPSSRTPKSRLPGKRTRYRQMNNR